MAPLDFLPQSSIGLALVALIFYVLIGGIYRLLFSPIAGFPGPKLAALTLWYEFYYDVVLRGQYTFHIRDLHRQYGPIIRINPYELHISDPAYVDTLYASSASGGKRDKWEWYTKQFGTSGAMFSTSEHDKHRARRAALSRFFSMASVRRLQPMIQERVERMMERLRDCKDKEAAIITTNVAFAGFTNDVVMEYSYGRSDHRVEADDFGRQYHDALMASGKAGSLLKQWIWILQLIRSLPEWLATRISPDLDLVVRLQRAEDNKTLVQRVRKQIIQIKSQPESTYRDLSHPTLFHELIQSDLSESDKSVQRLTDEALIVVGAGTITTSWTLAVATYHLLASPRILTILKNELKSAIPDPNIDVPLAVLDQLPYLAAVVQEALRLSYGVSSRLQRISPQKAMLFTDQRSGKQWKIPSNTPVGMTSVIVHHDESIFPDSKAFVPERWIENPRLDRYMLSFSKGSRQCIGINLAHAEMNLMLAAIFRRFGSGGKNGVRAEDDEGVLELWKTGLEDVEIEADGFIPLTQEGSKGVRIRVKS
ncbi:hypothetical protein MMC27_003417 [Xylographa pallens]|nr:hypothetical protein [Xylographa pallens]